MRQQIRNNINKKQDMYYIEKTFEVIKVLFDFPIKRFKSIVDNFIENIDK